MNALLAPSAPLIRQPEDDKDPVPVVAVACAPAWRAIIEAAGFSVTWYETVEDALAGVDATRPEALISGVLASPTLRRRWVVTIRTQDHLRRIPWIVVAQDADDDLLDALDAGADDFIVASTESGLFGLRLQALLRMIERLRGAGEKRGEPLTGTVGPGGPLSLLKFCENRRITGRLTIEANGERLWVLFKDGELVEAGPDGARDPLDAFLAAQGGSYAIDHDTPRLASPPPPMIRRDSTASSSQNPIAQPPGRLSRVEARGRIFQIQTESRNEPHFTITTIVDVGGQTMRKFESGWPLPLRRHSDYDAARMDIDRQHERVTRRIREMAAHEMRADDNAAEQVVVGTALVWATYFLAEHVCAHLGTAVTDSLMRRAHERARRSYPALGCFRVRAQARADLDPGGSPRSSTDLVLGVAAWMHMMLDDAGKVLHEAGHVSIRQTTSLMEPALDKIGFYVAFEQARKET